MPQVLTFGSPDEMRNFLRDSLRKADEQTHLAQAGLTWGDHWVRFIDYANKQVEFGSVFLQSEVLDLGLDSRTTAQGLEVGVMYGISYSRLSPDGEVGETHKAQVWPIDEDLFNAASGVNWQVELLGLGHKIALEMAFREWRAHRRSLRTRGVA